MPVHSGTEVLQLGKTYFCLGTMSSGHLQLSLLVRFVGMKTKIIYKVKIPNNLSVNFKLPSLKWPLSYPSAFTIPNTWSKVFRHTRCNADDTQYMRDTDIPRVGGNKEGSETTGFTIFLPSLTHCGALWKKRTHSKLLFWIFLVIAFRTNHGTDLQISRGMENLSPLPPSNYSLHFSS
jgi:hypothetical protein